MKSLGGDKSLHPCVSGTAAPLRVKNREIPGWGVKLDNTTESTGIARMIENMNTYNILLNRQDNRCFFVPKFGG